VCSGVAHQLGVDPVIVRIVAVALAFTGWGVLLYLLGWLALPEELPDGTIRPASANAGWPWLPVGVAILLAFALPAGFGFMFGHGPEFFPMLILFGFGFMIWRASRGRSRHHHGRHQHGWHGPPPVRPSGAPPVPPAAGGPWAEAGWAQSWAEPEPPRSPGGAGTGVAVPEWARADTDPPAAATPAPADPGLTEVSGEDPLLAEARRLSDPLQTEPYLFETAPSQASVALEVPPPRRHWGRRLVIAVVLVALGFVALVGALGPDEDGFVLASAVLVVIGGAMVVGGMRGRGRWLAFPGLAVLALLSIGSTVSITIEGGVGEVLIQPDSVSELEDSYNLGLGKLTIDLTSVTDFPSGRTVDIDADLGAGEMIVIVPAGATPRPAPARSTPSAGCPVASATSSSTSSSPARPTAAESTSTCTSGSARSTSNEAMPSDRPDPSDRRFPKCPKCPKRLKHPRPRRGVGDERTSEDRRRRRAGGRRAGHHRGVRHDRRIGVVRRHPALDLAVGPHRPRRGVPGGAAAPADIAGRSPAAAAGVSRRAPPERPRRFRAR
jgi:hypothetical protein